MSKITKKARNEAIARARAKLEKRSFGNDSWQVVLQYAYGEPNLQMSDRATALVLGAILEQGLELSILSHCVIGWNTSESDAEQKKLFGGSGDGSMNYAVKIRMAFALGVFGPLTRADLDIMRHVRNLFAHDRSHLVFDERIVSDLSEQIQWVEKYTWGGLAGRKPVSARSIYIATVRHLFPYLTVGIGRPIKYSTTPFGEIYG